MAAQSLRLLLSSSLTYRAPCNLFDTFLYRDLSFSLSFLFPFLAVHVYALATGHSAEMTATGAIWAGFFNPRWRLLRRLTDPL